MLKQSDIQGRLRLFRYGIIVVVVTAFLASFLSPVIITAPLGASAIGYMDALVPALMVTAIAAVIGVVAYFAYSAVLKRGEGSSS
jgi:nitrate reductase gamma subunit